MSLILMTREFLITLISLLKSGNSVFSIITGYYFNKYLTCN